MYWGSRNNVFIAHVVERRGVRFAGLCEAIVHVLKCHAESMEDTMIFILFLVIPFIPCRSDSARRMAVLVAGGVVEIAVGHCRHAKGVVLLEGLELLKHLMTDQGVMERLCALRNVKQLVNWIAKHLQEVSDS
jgi:hypothetical protein